MMTKQRYTRHGMGGTRIYHTWWAMKQRCFNPKEAAYRWYGAVGITVCDEWLEFLPFYEWAMNSGYTDNLTIDRFPKQDGNYEPTNCRWANKVQQARNKKNNNLIEHDGIKQSVSAWSEATGIKQMTIIGRLRRGMLITDVLNKNYVKKKKQTLKDKNLPIIIKKWLKENNKTQVWLANILKISTDGLSGRMHLRYAFTQQEIEEVNRIIINHAKDKNVVIV